MDKANAKKIEMKVESIEEIQFEDIKKSFASLENRDDLILDPDLMYARFIMCHEGANANGDYFTKEVLQRAQNTPKMKPIDWEHGQPYIGHILDSQYAETEQGVGYIEAVGVIWKFIYPDLASQIKELSASGGLKLSMECYYKDANYKYGDQIFNQEQADDLGLSGYVGSDYMGQSVYRVFTDVLFGGVGVVANPADKQAVFLSVAKQKAEAEEIVRNTNDFNTKQPEKQTVNAVTIAKFVKAFDKAKASIVSNFNQSEASAKDQVMIDVKNALGGLINDVSAISNEYYQTVASAEDELGPYLNPDDLGSFFNEDDSENLNEDDSEDLITDNYEVEDSLATNKKEDNMSKTNEETVVTNELVQPTVENVVVDEVDYKAEATNLKLEVEKLTKELEGKDTAFAGLQGDFEALKNKVEAMEKEEVLKSRLAELTGLGIEFSEARKAKEAEKISAMDNDTYEDYKALLVEIAGDKSPVVEAQASEVVEEVIEEVVVENVDLASAGLNMETPKPEIIKPFGHLAD